MTSPARPPLSPGSRIASEAYYKPAADVGVGFDVFTYRDRLVAWVAEEPVAKAMVDRLNGPKGDKPTTGEREGPSCD